MPSTQTGQSTCPIGRAEHAVPYPPGGITFPRGGVSLLTHNSLLIRIFCNSVRTGVKLQKLIQCKRSFPHSNKNEFCPVKVQKKSIW